MTAKSPRWIEKLLRSYQPDRNFLDGSRICREAIEKNCRKLRWIENAITYIEKRSPRGLIDRNLLRIYREAVELDKKTVFQREGKHTNMNANKQAT